MKITLTRRNLDFAMEAKDEDGHRVWMDASPDIGGTGEGMRPMQVLLSALGGCSSIDLIQILKKQKQKLRSFDVEITAERKKENTYALFTDIHLQFILGGEIDLEKANKAAKLAVESYCSVAKILEPTAKIYYNIRLK